MPQALIIHWFRQDLRLADNPALVHAAQLGQVLPIYILDDENAAAQRIAGAGRCWLHHSLNALNHSLQGQLRVYRGDAKTILKQLCDQHKVTAVCWNRCYEPWRIGRDQAIKQSLQAADIACHSFNGSLLWEPWQVLKADATPYKVFTPFYKNARLNGPTIRQPLAAPKALKLAKGKYNAISIQQLNLLPAHSWHQELLKHWHIGEAAAQKTLQQFITQGLDGYKEGRNFPAQAHVSRLSPHLHWGEISPQQAWHYSQLAGDNEDIAHFHNELAWRDFSYGLLYHFPELPQRNWQSKFDHFAWQHDSQLLKAWQQGQTGYPIIDAGMRELWQTGYMHNRVRMLVGSFLVKNLLIDWRHGEQWFWQTLVDADLANNSASWQWVAGCGADAAPYFRIFNPVTQGEKFDGDGSYTRRFVPELAALPNKYLHKPWQAPLEIQQQAGVKLGENYPQPIVDLKLSRERALASLKALP
ncbi:DNA photolyase family protein [Dasania sp. GY-MA-18]|uniref:Deoxyribodipyrimidine photo-lyase n=1 Tax=Dasania phycosphaerae TaxID=2950436 RepID=A0A9J6RHC7_9GAMM|nr:MULTISPECIES: deoxyribodipyrimidine photo-lyase [Dasania]MCR8921309.1 DNA photolyase family protein [Dasania sp. GY-MA-18]MCZ0863737.1 deoxyribodipyrimidine photo-lyase [Dasania phycosphaerae]MCZ0867465.1 deoxyribodipyrimidine photo-lyase [Dasania phycosphaerae]